MATDVAEQMEGLQSPDAERRLEAAEALCAMGDAASAAAVALIEAVADADERVREAANGALEAVENPPAAVTGELANKLSDANSACAFWAATLLGRIGSHASDAVGALSRTVADPLVPNEVRQKAAWALGRIGPAAQESLPELKKAQAAADRRLARLISSAIESIEG